MLGSVCVSVTLCPSEESGCWAGAEGLSEETGADVPCSLTFGVSGVGTALVIQETILERKEKKPPTKPVIFDHLEKYLLHIQ